VGKVYIEVRQRKNLLPDINGFATWPVAIRLQVTPIHLSEYFLCYREHSTSLRAQNATIGRHNGALQSERR